MYIEITVIRTLPNSILKNVHSQIFQEKDHIGTSGIKLCGQWNKHEYLLILLCCLLKFPIASQTKSGSTIIMRESPMGLFIGADSRVCDSAHIPLPIVECKIQTIGDNVVFFATGTTTIKPLYNSYQIVDSCLRASDSPQTARNVLIAKIMGTQEYFTRVLAGDSVRMNSLFDDHELFQCMTIRLSEKKFTYYLVSFSISMVSGTIVIKPDTTYDVGFGVWFFGKAEAAERSGIGATGRTADEVVNKIYRMIERQCSDPSNRTGKPIYILLWNREGKMKWYGDKEQC